MYIFRSILNRNSIPIYRHLYSRPFSHLNHANESSIRKSNKLFAFKSTTNRIKFSSRPNRVNDEMRKKARDVALYSITFVLVTLGLTYASVPLYRIYCQATGKGGKARIADDFLANKVKRMKKNKDKLINVVFVADKEAKMRWNFKPTQDEVKVYPGETALAFFTAKNPTDRPVIMLFFLII